MDVLKNLFGNLTSGLIRLAVAVGIIAAIGFFLVKPALDTTEHLSDSINESIQSTQKEFAKSFGPDSKANKAFEQANKKTQIQITRAYKQAKQAGGTNDQLRMLRCVQRAHGDVDRMQVCAVKFQS
jgi:F0F1-type ATP synthase membrane subunit b/b'